MSQERLSNLEILFVEYDKARTNAQLTSLQKKSKDGMRIWN